MKSKMAADRVLKRFSRQIRKEDALMVDIDALKRRFESLLPTVDERMRRLIAAAESLAIDYGVFRLSLVQPECPDARLRVESPN
jgi:hypothetical protein